MACPNELKSLASKTKLPGPPVTLSRQYLARPPGGLVCSGFQGSGVSLSLHAGKLIAQRLAGDTTANPLTASDKPLARYPLHRFIRIPQRAMYRWYRHLDNSD